MIEFKILQKKKQKAKYERNSYWEMVLTSCLKSIPALRMGQLRMSGFSRKSKPPVQNLQQDSGKSSKDHLGQVVITGQHYVATKLSTPTVRCFKYIRISNLLRSQQRNKQLFSRYSVLTKICLKSAFSFVLMLTCIFFSLSI